mmetsp:Transcript_49170/g.106767  ORF Transcript_49170/g.106767 Transcript_49170/m.106767 type:complete len:209 (-) Transcript_49170:81-707(-)
MPGPELSSAGGPDGGGGAGAASTEEGRRPGASCGARAEWLGSSEDRGIIPGSCDLRGMISAGSKDCLGWILAGRSCDGASLGGDRNLSPAPSSPVASPNLPGSAVRNGGASPNLLGSAVRIGGPTPPNLAGSPPTRVASLYLPGSPNEVSASGAGREVAMVVETRRAGGCCHEGGGGSSEDLATGRAGGISGTCPAPSPRCRRRKRKT